MPLWVLGLLVMGASMAYYVLVLADKQENNLVRQTGYVVGVTGLAAIFFSVLVRIFFLLKAFCT